MLPNVRISAVITFVIHGMFVVNQSLLRFCSVDDILLLYDYYIAYDLFGIQKAYFFRFAVGK